jgi:hypothetical protein
MGIASTATLAAGPRQLSDQNPIGTILGASVADNIGFYGLSQGVPQQTPAGYATLQTLGATTALYANSATTGGVGTTQYTFGDLVAILKAVNLLKQ